MKKTLLITGASGFIGSFLVEEGLRAGYEVWAAVRGSSSRRYLQDARIRFLEISLADEVALRGRLEEHVAQHGAFSAVIHAAGATKCRSAQDFFSVNTEGTLRLARGLTETKALEGRFVFVSSLSVMGALAEADLAQEIDASMQPAPNTAYGRSKLEAERGLAAIEGLRYVVLRPTGVYGPRERDYFMMAQSIARGVDFAVGFRPQRITFIYVRDLVQAAFLALENGRDGGVYLLSDGADYSSRAFSDLLQQALRRRHVLHIKAPLWVLRTVCALGERWGRLTHRALTLNLDKYHILRQRNWRCNIAPARQELGFSPQWPLERGVREAVAWYKENHWL